jgi:N-methylhydantoinase A
MITTKPTIRVAVDIGGTFTDIVFELCERRLTTKVLTTPQAPEIAVIEGMRAVLTQANKRFSDIASFVHGTTLATNAIIERKGASTALIATHGFRDVIEIADESRFDQYDINIEKPLPLVPRRLRFTVPERMDVHGEERLALDETATRLVAARLLEEKIASVAVSLIHAYVNPAHEQRIAAILAQDYPDISVSLSSEVCPEAREYERTLTTIANAYVQPLMAGYLQRLASMLATRGYAAPIYMMTSGGSLASLDTAARFPIRLVESGPAGGAILAARIAAERDEQRILSFDMGGTTAKICLIDDGRPQKARFFEMDRQSRFMKGSGMPIRVPVIEMVEIGAGGGSIARVDELGRILVGPESAGAEPGPASYARGGTRPTVTDADLMLGKIDPARFAGGRIAIDPAKATDALKTGIGRPLGLEVERSAYGVAEIVDENMANAARVHAIERGAAITERTLIAFGGAAPLHASRLAEKLGIGCIIIPLDAGVGSAIGFLEAPAAYELVRSRYMRLDQFDAPAIGTLLEDMSREARRHCISAAGGRTLAERRSAFMRYAGQGHEILVALPNRALTSSDEETLRLAFEAEYRHLFARHIPDAVIEIMSWVVLVTTEDVAPLPLARVAPIGAPKPASVRSVFDAALGRRIDALVYDRDALPCGAVVSGPALIVEDGTTTYVSPDFNAAVDAGAALVLKHKI